MLKKQTRRILPLQGWEDPPLAGLGRWFPSPRRGQAKHTRRRPNQQAHGMVLRRRSKRPPRRCQRGRNSTGAVGCAGEGALPGCPRAAFPEMVHRTARSLPVPLQVTPVCPSWHFQDGSTWTGKERQAETSPSFRQGCSGMLWAGFKVHRDKGRVRELEGGGHCGGAQASTQQRDIPQKRPLELHREGTREKKEKEKRSVAAQ